MLPGYTQSIINHSETEQLVTVMYGSVMLIPERRACFREGINVRKGKKYSA